MENLNEMDLETIKDLKEVLSFARSRFTDTLFMWDCEDDYPYILLHDNQKDKRYVYDTIIDYIRVNYVDKKWRNSLIIAFDVGKDIILYKDIVHHISYTRSY